MTPQTKKPTAYYLGLYGTIATVVLFFIFTALKLCGVVAWSWWVVALPIWGPFLIALISVIIAVVLIAALGDKLKEI